MARRRCSAGGVILNVTWPNSLLPSLIFSPVSKARYRFQRKWICPWYFQLWKKNHIFRKDMPWNNYLSSPSVVFFCATHARLELWIFDKLIFEYLQPRRVKLNSSASSKKIDEHQILIIRNLSFRLAIAFQRPHIFHHSEIIFHISDILTSIF